MAGWHHWLNGHEFEYTMGVGDGQGGLACCGPWDCKESDMTERLNWTEPANQPRSYPQRSMKWDEEFFSRLPGVLLGSSSEEWKEFAEKSVKLFKHAVTDKNVLSFKKKKKMSFQIPSQTPWLLSKFMPVLGFPGSTSFKELTCQYRRHKKLGFDSWVRKIHRRRTWQPTPAFLPGESQGQRMLGGLQSKGSQRVEHNWSDLACTAYLPVLVLRFLKHNMETMIKIWYFSFVVS